MPTDYTIRCELVDFNYTLYRHSCLAISLAWALRKVHRYRKRQKLSETKSFAVYWLDFIQMYKKLSQFAFNQLSVLKLLPLLKALNL